MLMVVEYNNSIRCTGQAISLQLQLLPGAVRGRNVHSTHPPSITLLLVQRHPAQSAHCIYDATLVHVDQRKRIQTHFRYESSSVHHAVVTTEH